MRSSRGVKRDGKSAHLALSIVPYRPGGIEITAMNTEFYFVESSSLKEFALS